MSTELSKVDWDCEFFHGENEERLLETTLNDLEPELLPKFIKVLNDYLSSPGFYDGGYPAERLVTEIIFDGCEDVKLTLANGKVIEEFCSETTFLDFLEVLSAV